MDDDKLALRRRQMGTSIQELVTANGGRAIGEVGDGFWFALTAVPSADMNVVLVDSARSSVRDEVRTLVEERGVPAVFMLAGPAAKDTLGEGWQHVGSMPLMACSLEDAALARDPRVRVATGDDRDVVTELLAHSYTMTKEVASGVSALLDIAARATIWLLVEDGRGVSTVLSSVVDDALCLWCMATPPAYQRRGYARGLLGEVLWRGRDQGARIGLLGATPAGKPLYDATGWATIEEWQLYLNAASAQFVG